ncbi:biotin--[acetyl-CoA-carboxylase] ligase [Acidipila sp. EB88]|nr:biotin--[acetyl-CoA-carboxylase] ligase [Acidipila sp. EB88]
MSGVPADAFDLQALRLDLADTCWTAIEHFNEIASTNTHAMRAGVDGAEHGTVYIADAQTGGRGRGAHAWASPAGSGLYVSMLLRPALAPGDALWLSLAAGVAAQAAVRSVAADSKRGLKVGPDLRVDLRWPNDLLVGTRKLGGVLTEMQAEATRVRFVVVGIGINVHQQSFPAELATGATSLAIEQIATTRQRLLLALLRAVHHEVQALTAVTAEARTLAQQQLRIRLEQGSSWMRGKRVHVGEENAYVGTTEGLDARGFLLVRTDAGELRTVLSGGVRAAE